MKTITIYETDDGSRFEDPQKAIDYEYLCSAIDQIMSNIAPRTSDVDYGKDYIKHNPLKVEFAFNSFMYLCETTYPEYAKIFQEIREDKRHRTHSYHIIEENDDKCMVNALNRFKCINFLTCYEVNNEYSANNIFDTIKVIEDRKNNQPIDEIDYENLPF